MHWKGGIGPRGKWGHKAECKKPILAPEKFIEESKVVECSDIDLEVEFKCKPKNLYEAFTDASDIMRYTNSKAVSTCDAL